MTSLLSRTSKPAAAFSSQKATAKRIVTQRLASRTSVRAMASLKVYVKGEREAQLLLGHSFGSFVCSFIVKLLCQSLFFACGPKPVCIAGRQFGWLLTSACTPAAVAAAARCSSDTSLCQNAFAPQALIRCRAVKPAAAYRRLVCVLLGACMPCCTA
jgi:hypothetical protein